MLSAKNKPLPFLIGKIVTGVRNADNVSTEFVDFLGLVGRGDKGGGEKFEHFVGWLLRDA